MRVHISHSRGNESVGLIAMAVVASSSGLEVLHQSGAFRARASGIKAPQYPLLIEQTVCSFEIRILWEFP
jgi:hypothetical protein